MEKINLVLQIRKHFHKNNFASFAAGKNKELGHHTACIYYPDPLSTICPSILYIAIHYHCFNNHVINRGSWPSYYTNLYLWRNLKQRTNKSSWVTSHVRMELWFNILETVSASNHQDWCGEGQSCTCIYLYPQLALEAPYHSQVGQKKVSDQEGTPPCWHTPCRLIWISRLKAVDQPSSSSCLMTALPGLGSRVNSD